MTIYTDVFGGANIYPSEVSYSSITPTTDVVLSWPEETSTSSNLATRIIDVTASPGVSIFLPDASKTATGQTILFNNRGTNSFIVKNADGTQVVTVVAGTIWQIYLTNNTSAAGTWVSLQYGSSISQANASALAGTGIVAIGALLSQSVPTSSFNSNYTAGVNDRAKMFIWTGGAGTFSLPAAPSVGSDWFCYLKNSGTGNIVVDPYISETIDGSLTLSFSPGDSAIIVSDGSNYVTIGFGQSSVFAFDYTVVGVGGTGNYTLSGTELNRIAYNFTGALTGDRNIIVPNTVQQYWISNQTTGAYSLTVKTASGSGIIVAQGARAILYCDGTDVVNASTAGVSFPIAVSQGGTGAITAGSALINLGGTSLGVALFTSVDQAAAWAALGAAPAGTVAGGVF